MSPRWHSFSSSSAPENATVRDAPTLLRRLLDRGVRFVLVGGFAAVAHGSTRVTRDIDVCLDFSTENLQRLLAALEGIHPQHRAGPVRRPLDPDAGALSVFRALYLETDLGELDLLREITGLGGFDDVLRRSESLDLWGSPVPVLGLDALIESKRAISREKDREVLLELEALRERRPR
jgi:predicted nucleotidyltransferase